MAAVNAAATIAEIEQTCSREMQIFLKDAEAIQWQRERGAHVHPRRPAASSACGSSGLGAAESKEILHRALATVGLGPAALSDPAAMARVMDRFQLRGFEPSWGFMHVELRKMRCEPVPLGPFLESMVCAVVRNHPSLVEFAAICLKMRRESDGAPVLQAHPAWIDAVLFGFVLERITAAMSNSVDFAEELRNHMYSRRQAVSGVDPASVCQTFVKVWHQTGSLFPAMKTISVDPAMSYYAYFRRTGGRQIVPADLDHIYAQMHSDGAGSTSHGLSASRVSAWPWNRAELWNLHTKAKAQVWKVRDANLGQ